MQAVARVSDMKASLPGRTKMRLGQNRSAHTKQKIVKQRERAPKDKQNRTGLYSVLTMKLAARLLLLIVVIAHQYLALAQGKSPGGKGGNSPTDAPTTTPEPVCYYQFVLPEGNPFSECLLQAFDQHLQGETVTTTCGERRQLSTTEHQAERRRELYPWWCVWFCEGWPIGHCWIVYPACWPLRRRRLVGT